MRADLQHMLEAVAEALGETLRERLVFVGGCTTALLITDPVTREEVRATDDVDLIVKLSGYNAWTELQGQLRAQGFMEAPDEAVICRMRLGRLNVDFMPDDPEILGFSNRWYDRGIATAVAHPLTERLTIRRLTAPLFLATKFEAYLGRGAGDLLGSRDLEDILLIVDGRPEIVDEIAAADEDVRLYVGEQVRALMARGRDFDDFLEGNILGPVGRTQIVRERFEALSRHDN